MQVFSRPWNLQGVETPPEDGEGIWQAGHQEQHQLLPVGRHPSGSIQERNYPGIVDLLHKKHYNVSLF